MRMTSKGQVTIPKQVREKLGIEPGDDVGFREEGGHFVLTSKPAGGRRAAGEAQFAALMEKIRKLREDGSLQPLGMSVDDYMKLIRGDAADEDHP